MIFISTVSTPSSGPISDCAAKPAEVSARVQATPEWACVIGQARVI